MKIGIVDAFSTGKNLALEFISKGVECYHIRTTSTPYTDDVRFKKTIFIDENINDTIDILKYKNLNYIIAGSEMGVESTDYIANNLGIKHSNNYKTTYLRRNKYEMHKKLKESNLRHINQFKSSSEIEIIKWVNKQQKFPIVIKPIDGAASEGVTICDDIKSVKMAIKKILGKKNILGKINKEILAQEFIDGTQYFINTLTWEGKTFISDIWEQVRTREKNSAYIFEGMHLCDGNIAEKSGIKKYIYDVLNEFGLYYGAAHNEIIMTQEGPVLIESNARLMGASISNEAFHEALGYTQASLCVFMYLEPKKFKQEYIDKNYQKNANLSEVSFVFKKDGIIKSMPTKNTLINLTSFHSFNQLPEMNKKVYKTKDTIGEPGFLYLLHKDKTIVEKDFDYILQLQQEDKIFEIVS
ncbi:ATP-grasp domain-containing protein [Xenorhabdus japonica]|uniref:ATP-grasp domain-containing protein n=1 Tax=Xenorhabdus japonica TaxID=53341 RepID=A0A1I4YD93_9GAMM|nr:ATP-grasp domain-containing protein [Xenorhabdus japonica]SFN35946.1 ATP-grasp domain-containing protein [Xenorhabdus japonica]